MLSFNLLYLASTLLRFGFVTSQDGLNEVQYIGCFSTQYAQNRDLGLSFHPFSWESCVLLCQSKGSRYAGLVQRSSMCYCGSYLVENSKVFLPKDCPYSCTGLRRRSCGGESQMTVYKLKDDTLPRVIVCNRNIISYVKNNQLVPILKLESSDDTYLIRGHYKNNEIYFIVYNDLVKSQYSTTTNSYSNSLTTVVQSVGRDRPFVVDWVSDKLYYESGKSIWEANLNGTDQKVLDIAGTVYSMEIDPYEKKLYFNSEFIALKEYNINNNVVSTIHKCQSINQYPMALDVHTQGVYGIIGPSAIMRKRPSDAEFVTAVNVTAWGSVTYVVALDDSTIFYTQQKENSLFLQYKDGPVNVKLAVDIYTAVLAIHEVIQAPTKKVACDKLGCSHSCQYSPQSYARCVCPSDMQLDSTRRRCTSLMSSRHSREDSDYTDDSDYSKRRRSEDYSSDYSDTKEDSESDDERSSYEELPRRKGK